MSKILVNRAEELAWNTVRELTREREALDLSEEDLDAEVAYHVPGSADSPQLFEVSYGPNAAIAVHAHDEDEIIYILEGEMRFGTRSLNPGSSVFIKGGAFYSFRSGEHGLRFLNFRPRADYSYHPGKKN